MGVFDVPSSWFGLELIGDDSSEMSGGSNTSRACIRETRKKESEKINVVRSTLCILTGADGEDEARMKKNTAEDVVRVKPPERLEQMSSVKERNYFSQEACQLSWSLSPLFLTFTKLPLGVTFSQFARFTF